MRVVGFDPSLRNWGLASGNYNLLDGTLSITHLGVLQPLVPTGKQVRQNSKDLESAAELFQNAMIFAGGARAVFVEVPVGSQSSRAMASYGICVGVLGAIRASGIPFFEVTPTEVKMSTVGSKTASKAEMIAWAMAKHPEGNWPYQTVSGVQRVIESKAEHMADAIGSVVAGIRTQPFQQLVSFSRTQPATT